MDRQNFFVQSPIYLSVQCHMHVGAAVMYAHVSMRTRAYCSCTHRGVGRNLQAGEALEKRPYKTAVLHEIKKDKIMMVFNCTSSKKESNEERTIYRYIQII